MKLFKFLLAFAAMGLSSTAMAEVTEVYSIDLTGRTENPLQNNNAQVTMDETDGLVHTGGDQFWIAKEVPFTNLQFYTVKAMMKSSEAKNVHIYVGNWGDDFGGDVSLTTEFQEVSFKIQGAYTANCFMAVQHWGWSGTISVKSVTVTTGDEGYDTDLMCLNAKNLVTKTNVWDQQVNYDFKTDLEAGTYTLSFDVYGTANGSGDITRSFNAKDPENEYIKSMYGGCPYAWYGWGFDIVADTWKHYEFEMTTPATASFSNTVNVTTTETVNGEEVTTTTKVTTEYTDAPIWLASLGIRLGKYEGNLLFDNVLFIKSGSAESLIPNGRFSELKLGNWSKGWAQEFDLTIENGIAHEAIEYDYTATNVKSDVFDMEKASNFDQENDEFTAKGGWDFETPQDFSDYKWMIIVSSHNARNVSKKIYITDSYGQTISGDDYNNTEAGSRGGMYMDAWNNRICAAVNLDYLKNKGMDITKIAKLNFDEGCPLAAVFLTNYADGQAVASTQNPRDFTGDVTRPYASNKSVAPNRFGTIVLPYEAAACGAQIYEVQSFTPGSSLSVSRHYGVMEAGKPYFYYANDAVGNGDNENDDHKVHFLRAGSATASLKDANGLVGTFADTKCPTTGSCYILSNNKLCRVTANGTNVNVQANRCYFDSSVYSGPTPAPGKISIPTDETTGINAINSDNFNPEKIYDINGREVKSIERGGIYIINGMKVFVK